MIPFILAALGGAFIGNALSSDDKKIESETILDKDNFEDGGAVPNNYEGKTAEHIWGDWTTEQREHYIVDHFGVKALDNDYQNKDWDYLPSDVQIHTEIHIMQGQYAKGGIIVTKISDIPDLESEVEKGKVTYRGLGLGKLWDDFYSVANEQGTRIKVKGKEYFITDTDFRKLAWDEKKGGWNGKIRFAAPHRRFSNGGGIEKPEYKIFEGYDHFKGESVYRVDGVENDYVGEWHKDIADAQKELEDLNKKFEGVGVVMSLDEYIKQEDPIRNPKVILKYKNGDYIKGSTINTGRDTLTRVYVNGFGGIEYVKKGSSKSLFATDSDGNPIGVSVFFIGDDNFDEINRLGVDGEFHKTDDKK